MIVDPNDDWVSYKLMKEGFWEKNITQLLKKYVKPGQTAMNIGGHIGYHAIMLSKLVGDKGKLIVFEPAPNNHKYL